MLRHLLVCWRASVEDAHFEDIRVHESDIENRMADTGFTADWIKSENRKVIDGFQSVEE